MEKTARRKRSTTKVQASSLLPRRGMPTIIETAPPVGNVLTFSPVIASYHSRGKIKKNSGANSGRNRARAKGETEEIEKKKAGKEIAAENKGMDEGAGRQEGRRLQIVGHSLRKGTERRGREGDALSAFRQRSETRTRIRFSALPYPPSVLAIASARIMKAHILPSIVPASMTPGVVRSPRGKPK